MRQSCCVLCPLCQLNATHSCIKGYTCRFEAQLHNLPNIYFENCISIHVLRTASQAHAQGHPIVLLWNLFHHSAADADMSFSCLQAYGAKQYAMVGHIWQRAMIILGLLCVPISVLLLFATPILLATGQTTSVATMTGSYIR